MKKKIPPLLSIAFVVFTIIIEVQHNSSEKEESSIRKTVPLVIIDSTQYFNQSKPLYKDFFTDSITEGDL